MMQLKDKVAAALGESSALMLLTSLCALSSMVHDAPVRHLLMKIEKALLDNNTEDMDE